jgi:hypothetical protein
LDQRLVHAALATILPGLEDRTIGWPLSSGGRSSRSVLHPHCNLPLPLPSSIRKDSSYSDAGWSSLVARRAHNPKVAGSIHSAVGRYTRNSMEALLIVATTVTAIGTLLLAAATVYLAQRTSAMVKEMEAGRAAQERPYVVVDLDYERRYPHVYIVVRNDGIRSASNIRFQFSAPVWSLAYADGSSEADIASEIGYFNNGIDVLAPGAEIPCLWDNRERVIRTIRRRNLTEGIAVTVTYEALDGRRYKDVWKLNPELFAKRRLVAPEKNPLETVATHLDNIVYILALETRRRWWRRFLNIRAYDPNSLEDQVRRFEWQERVQKMRNALRLPRRNGRR